MYDWIRGGDFTFGIRVKSGVVIAGTTIRCALKLATVKHGAPVPDAEELVVFKTQFVLATPAVGTTAAVLAHWLFSATWDQGEALAVGEYIADAKIIDVEGNTVQTKSILINVLAEVTRKRS